MKLINKLEKLKACQEGKDWAGDKSIKEAWDSCNRPDWMMWYVVRGRLLSKRKLVGLAGRLAGTVSHIYNERYPNDSRIDDCIQATQDYSNGIINLKQLLVFRDASYAAYAAYDAAAAASYAADTAATAATAAADATAASYAATAANAATAAAAAASYAATADAAASYAADASYIARADRKKHRIFLCDMIREEVKLGGGKG